MKKICDFMVDHIAPIVVMFTFLLMFLALITA